MNALLVKGSKLLTASSLSIAIMTSAQQASAAAMVPSQQPLFLTQGVEPNILVTLDDSGSMAFAYAPDSAQSERNRNYFKSNYFNPMYYSPTTEYKLPKKVTLVSGELKITEYDTPIFTAAWKNGFTKASTVNLSSNYAATVEYGRGADTETAADGRAHYYEYRPNNANCNKTKTDTDCYSKVNIPATAAAEKNFAIWYSFYRTRALATQTAANLAFYSLPENVRLTWQVLNNSTCNVMGSGSSSGNCNTNYLREFSGQHRANFFTWLEKLSVTGGTPLRQAMQRAGNFLSQTGINGPYAYSLGKQTNPEYACRPTYHILMTDGIWNSDSASVGNADNTNIATLPDGKSYTAIAPYKDGASNTVADLAFNYWRQDARTNIDNKIKPFISAANPTDSTKEYWDPRNNPSTWQNMTTFTLGLGLTSSLTSPAWGGSTFEGDYGKLADGSIAWPAASADSANNVYDLWHAAINSRGEFFSADSPEDMVSAFQTILTRIGDRNNSAARPAITAKLQESPSGDTLLRYAYQSSFDSSKNWAGDLIRYKLEEKFGITEKIKEWSAQEKLEVQDPDSRKIMIAGNSATNLVDFQWSNLNAAQRALLNRNPDSNNTVDALGEARLQFIRGKSNANFRNRVTRLGDIINSAPAVVANAQYLAYLANPIEFDSIPYEDFKNKVDTTSTTQGRKRLIYVGANDGMLHAFDEATGKEEFAFIPSTIFEKLNLLAGNSYKGSAHQFYVDGSPVVADTVIDGEWRTVLIGTFRAGGKGIFALDVTDPSKIKLLWEINLTTEVDMGHSMPKPTVARLHNGQWAVVTGNGYSSQDDKAALLIFNVKDGSLIRKLEVKGKEGIPNGLSTPKLADNNSDGVADYAYAGDLQGNMWRFDLLTKTTADVSLDSERLGRTSAVSGGKLVSAEKPENAKNFKVSFGGKPLFSAQASDNSSQAITAAPSIVRHPSSTGYIIVFGTGKYFQSSDAGADTSRAQTLYGIWDKQTKGQPASTTPSINRSKVGAEYTYLAEQTFTEEVNNATFTNEAGSSNNRNIRILSQNPLEWHDSTTGKGKYGWLLDFKVNTTLEGEMVVDDMVAIGQVLLAQTLTPNDDPCADGVSNWTYGINPATGGRLDFAVFDLARQGYVDSRSNYKKSDGTTVPVSGYQNDGMGGLIVTTTPEGQIQVCTSSSCETIDPGLESSGRQSWRIVEDY